MKIIYVFAFIHLKMVSQRLFTSKIFCHCYFLTSLTLLIKIILEIFMILRFVYWIYATLLFHTKIIILKGIFLKFSSTVSHFSNSVVNIYRHFKPVNRVELLSALIDEENKTIQLIATKPISVWLKWFWFFFWGGFFWKNRKK